jgi:hypothetical protein
MQAENIAGNRHFAVGTEKPIIHLNEQYNIMGEWTYKSKFS